MISADEARDRDLGGMRAIILWMLPLAAVQALLLFGFAYAVGWRP